jgi:hypothetical protein
MLWTQKRNDQSFPSCGSKGYTVRGYSFFVGHLIHAAYPISVQRYLETLLYLMPSLGQFFFLQFGKVCYSFFFCLGHTHTHIHIDIYAFGSLTSPIIICLLSPSSPLIPPISFLFYFFLHLSKYCKNLLNLLLYGFIVSLLKYNHRKNFLGSCSATPIAHTPINSFFLLKNNIFLESNPVFPQRC